MSLAFTPALTTIVCNSSDWQTILWDIMPWQRRPIVPIVCIVALEATISNCVAHFLLCVCIYTKQQYQFNWNRIIRSYYNVYINNVLRLWWHCIVWGTALPRLQSIVCVCIVMNEMPEGAIEFDPETNAYPFRSTFDVHKCVPFLWVREWWWCTLWTCTKEPHFCVFLIWSFS